MKSTPAIAPPPYRTERAALERDVVMETFRTGGPGGQHRNVTDSAVRLLHRPSGVRVTATESRSQARNRETAFRRLADRLQRLNQVKRSRIPTRPSARAKERRLAVKRHRRQRLERRGRVQDDA